MKYWLMKSEPEAYSIDALKRDGKTFWNGVRNYQARNFLRDEVKTGDWVLFYHSNAEPSGVAGLARVTSPGYPDPSALDRKSPYFDPKATKENPIWYVVDVEFAEKFPRLIELEELKAQPDLQGMLVLKRGQRLSVQPVERAHFEAVRRMAKSHSKVHPSMN